jgi:hypothetical protein
MKPLVLKAQAKELFNFFKTIEDLDKDNLLQAQQKTLKILMEISENIERIE